MRKTARKKPDYVWDRPGTDIYWFSRAVPKRLWDVEGKNPIQFSLKTRDRSQAEAMARQHAASLDVKWGLVPPTAALPTVRRTPTEDELEEAAVIVGNDLLLDDADEGRKSLLGRGAVMWEGNANWVRGELQEQQRYAATGDHSLVTEDADLIVEALGFDLPRGGDGYAMLCEKLNAVRMSALQVKLRRALGEVDVESTSPIVRRVREREAERAKAGESILELFDRWSEEQLAKGEKRPDTVTHDRKKIAQFAAFVGTERSVRSIAPVEVADYRDLLRNLPPKWKSNKQLAGLNVREAASKARELGLAQASFSTVNSHLSAISPLYDWLRKQPAWAGLINPCSGLFYDKVKGKNPRPPFSTDQLNRILVSPLFTGFIADGKEHLPGATHADDWRKWIPLLCMFTGARIGEIAQLRIRDIRQERGVWFVHIRHDVKAGLSTKSGKSRPAAVHRMLETIGFLDFLKRQSERAGGDENAPLFPELTPNSRGQISGEPSRWWRDYLTAIGIKQGADGLGSHAFRHTLADRLRSEAELLDDQIEVCLGHNQKTTTSGYGALSQGTVNLFKGWADAVRFDGVDFSKLIAKN